MQIQKWEKLIFCFLFGFSILIFLESCKKGAKTINKAYSFEAMDTVMKITVNGETDSQIKKALDETFGVIKAIEKKLSVTDEKSVIYALNDMSNHEVNTDNTCFSFELDDELRNLMAQSLILAELSEGFFNPLLFPITSAWGFTNGNYRIPQSEEIQDLLKYTDYKSVKLVDNFVQMEPKMMFDFGAIAKGYTGDKVIETLRKIGITSGLLDFGGNIQALGYKADGTEWKVGIKCPWSDGVVAAISIHDEAVITSGGYNRFFTGEDGQEYIHIFDGRTGKPAETDLLSATIVCEAGTYGDALSTACFVMGKEKAVEFWRNSRDNIDDFGWGRFDMILITKDKSIYYTKNLNEKFFVPDNLNKSLNKNFNSDIKAIEVIE